MCPKNYRAPLCNAFRATASLTREPESSACFRPSAHEPSSNAWLRATLNARLTRQRWLNAAVQAVLHKVGQRSVLALKESRRQQWQFVVPPRLAQAARPPGERLTVCVKRKKPGRTTSSEPASTQGARLSSAGGAPGRNKRAPLLAARLICRPREAFTRCHTSGVGMTNFSAGRGE